MNNDQQLKAAFTGAKYVIHTAASTIFAKNVTFQFLENEIVQSTHKVLQAAADCKV